MVALLCTGFARKIVQRKQCLLNFYSPGFKSLTTLVHSTPEAEFENGGFALKAH